MRRPEHVVVRCARCSLAHVLPRPERDTDHFQLGDLATYEAAMKRLQPGVEYHAAKLLRMLSAQRPPPGALLEVGCATGQFLLTASKAGYAITGLEPAASHRQLIPAAIASSVLPEKLEDADLPDNTFDVIVAIQLLEHLLDPVVFAERLKRVMKRGGVAYIETPNFDCVSRRLSVASWLDNNVTGGHWHLFNPRSMQMFCDRMGLRIIRLWTFFKALGIHSRAPAIGKSVGLLDHTLGVAGLGNNVAALITRD